MAPVLVKNIGDKKTATESTTSLDSDGIPPLGVPADEKRFWFQRARDFDPEAIATQVTKPRAQHRTVLEDLANDGYL